MSELEDQRDSARQAAAVVSDAAERVLSVFYDYAARGTQTTAADGSRAESELMLAMQQLREAVKIADSMSDNSRRGQRS